MVHFANNLKEKYPDTYDKYRLYHLLIGSTPIKEKLLFFDFPGEEDSVRKFINESFKNLLKQREEAIFE